MIRKLIGRMFRRGVAEPPAVRRHATRYRGSELGIHRTELSSAAQRTCETLQKAGFHAWIVGGGVRDLLLGLRPKDFDIATDATPQQVNKLFRRSRVIGRRFQIVHVMFGREVIEVSTYRALSTDSNTDEHGRVLHDNEWGTQEEDAVRRDFTINALYYDPIGDAILDYHDGVRDLQARTLRMIGDPASRYREDPVRMLRVARFAAKLGFTVEPRTRAPIAELAPLVHNIPSSRLFDEMLKLLLCGHALDALGELRNEGLHHGLLPLLDVILEQPAGERFVSAALASTDARVADGRPVSPGFLFATLLWQQVRVRWEAAAAKGEHSIPALMQAIDDALDDQADQLAIQKRFVSDMREIWSLQPRLERRNGQAPYRLLEHIRFRAAYDFMLLRCEVGEVDQELGAWWSAFIDADGEGRAALVTGAPKSGPAAKRKGRGGPRRRGRRGATAGGDSGGDSGSPPA